MYFISLLKSSNKHSIIMNFTVTITCLLYGIFRDVHGNLQKREWNHSATLHRFRYLFNSLLLS